MLQKLTRYFSTLWGYTCILCQAKGIDGIDLCQSCLEELPWLGHHCRQCAMPLSQESGSAQYCKVCMHAPLSKYRVFSPFIYKTPINRLLNKLKLKNDFSVSNVLGQLMGNYIKEAYREGNLPQLIIPMPLHNTRLKKLGFNPALELARPISNALKIQIDYKSCTRVRDTLPQASLSEQAKLENVKNAFKIKKTIYYDYVCLIDDFMTSGFTALSCSKTLFENGVKKVDVWCLARAGIKF